MPGAPSPSHSVRRRPTQLRHLIEDVTAEDGFRLLPRATACVKALAVGLEFPILSLHRGPGGTLRCA